MCNNKKIIRLKKNIFDDTIISPYFLALTSTVQFLSLSKWGKILCQKGKNNNKKSKIPFPILLNVRGL